MYNFIEKEQEVILRLWEDVQVRKLPPSGWLAELEKTRQKKIRQLLNMGGMHGYGEVNCLMVIVDWTDEDSDAEKSPSDAERSLEH